MADLLPSSSDVSGPETDEPRVVGVDSDAADELLAALSSRTARRVLSALHDDPATPARLAERVDTSLQNAQYHLGNLEDAGLVEVADTVYSEKGREMSVYAPADRALVVVATHEEETTGLKATLKRLLGSVGVLGLASLLVERLLGPSGAFFAAQSGSGESTAGEDGSGGGADVDAGTAGSAGGAGGSGSTDVDTSATAGDAAATTARTTAESTPGAEAATRTAAEATTAAADPTTVVDAVAGSPGLVFFLGGLTALLLVFLLLRR